MTNLSSTTSTVSFPPTEAAHLEDQAPPQNGSSPASRTQEVATRTGFFDPTQPLEAQTSPQSGNSPEAQISPLSGNSPTSRDHTLSEVYAQSRARAMRHLGRLTKTELRDLGRSGTKLIHPGSSATMLRRLGRITYLMKCDISGAIFVRKKSDKAHRSRTDKYVKGMLVGTKHPNHQKVVSGVKHRDGSAEIDVEYCNGGCIGLYTKLFPDSEATQAPATVGAAAAQASATGGAAAAQASATVGAAAAQASATTDAAVPLNEAKSRFVSAIARQVAEGLHYIHGVHGRPHGDVNSTTVFVGHDGCCKLSNSGVLSPDQVRENPYRYLETPYCAPELKKRLSDGRCDEVHRANACTVESDVWELGVSIVEFYLEKSLRPKWKEFDFYMLPPEEQKDRRERAANGEPLPPARRVPLRGEQPLDTVRQNDDDDGSTAATAVATEYLEAPSQEEINAFRNDVKPFFDLLKNKNWEEVIPDPTLRFLAQRCLEENPADRWNLQQICAFIHLIGGLQESNGNNDMSKLACEFREKREIWRSTKSEVRDSIPAFQFDLQTLPHPWKTESRALSMEIPERVCDSSTCEIANSKIKRLLEESDEFFSGDDKRLPKSPLARFEKFIEQYREEGPLIRIWWKLGIALNNELNWHREIRKDVEDHREVGKLMRDVVKRRQGCCRLQVAHSLEDVGNKVIKGELPRPERPA